MSDVKITVLNIGRLDTEERTANKSAPNSPRLSVSLVEFHVAHHCNLTCTHCAHFSPQLRRQNIPQSSIEADLAAAARTLAPQHVQILGGEPLLNPQLPELIPLFRRYFSNAVINVVTNGILLLRMPSTFYQSLSANNVGIVVSCYPDVSLNMPLIQQRCIEFGVYLECWHQDTFLDFLNPSGNSDPVEARANCPMEGCLNIRDQRVFPCPVAAWADFGGLPFNSSDGLPLMATIDELSTILNRERVTSACAYCRVKPERRPHKLERPVKLIEGMPK